MTSLPSVVVAIVTAVPKQSLGGTASAAGAQSAHRALRVSQAPRTPLHGGRSRLARTDCVVHVPLRPGERLVGAP